MRDFTHIDENNLINNGFIILDYDENLNELLLSYDTNTFKNIHLPLSSWKCKIKKLKQGKLFEILMKYEKLAFKLYEDILKIDLEQQHYNSDESLSSIIYYDNNSGYHGEHTDYGLFNVILNNNSMNCMYYEENGNWKLFESKNKMIIMNGDEIEKISDGKLKAVNHKVIKPRGFERYIVTKICYPKNQRNELLKKNSWLNV